MLFDSPVVVVFCCVCVFCCSTLLYDMCYYGGNKEYIYIPNLDSNLSNQPQNIDIPYQWATVVTIYLQVDIKCLTAKLI